MHAYLAASNDFGALAARTYLRAVHLSRDSFVIV
jgi:hypothetical protein